MKSIRIIKQKQNANEATTEDKKPVEPSTRKIANTVKSWVEESQERRRNLPRTLTAEVWAYGSTATYLLRWSDGRVKQDQLRGIP